jgi:hypothetical protein
LNVFDVALPYVSADPPTFDGMHRCRNWPVVLVTAQTGSENITAMPISRHRRS